MADTVIQARNLGKRYTVGKTQRHDTLRDHIAGSFKRLFLSGNNRPKNSEQEIWALRNLDFSVEQGEMVGIIGPNGAGKSTLLKILSEITDPTTGEAHIEGRVASLLELGVGFHTELTGRENIFLKGAILGLSRREIQKRFDDIVGFSGVEKFVDTPVKHYSSGMYIRLAFSVVAFLDAEILLMDEVLAVGDVAFRKKCLGVMAEALKSGRTILLASHELSAVEQQCGRCLLLDEGELLFAGDTRAAIQAYLDLVEKRQAWTISGSGSADGDLKLRDSRIFIPHSPEPYRIKTGRTVCIAWDLEARRECSVYVFATIEDYMGRGICAFDSRQSGLICHLLPGHNRVEISIPSLPLLDGIFRINVEFYQVNSEGIGVSMLTSATSQLIVQPDGLYNPEISHLALEGVMHIEHSWNISRSTADSSSSGKPATRPKPPA